ncbi:FK506-binding protein 5 isoform X1 [Drosophila sechellia]|uniref:GM15819 n=1 Tax=Drosophila sechellia TaxID=7238 RepID=B4I7L9_DROSE|nr:FK506-binding protein 5 isoform X1 [Drosophila sechellia]EDW56594.1 GM15819 [Drosophila sechellia]
MHPHTTELLTSADIEDGKVEFDKATGATTSYKVIEGGYEVITTSPQPNGTIKTQVRTFWDPKPVSEEDLKKEQENKKLVQKRLGKEIRIDERTTMLTRAIEGGYEEVYTTINEDGTRSSRTKTFYDSVPTEVDEKTAAKLNKNKKNVTRKSSVDSTDSTESSRRIVQKQQKNLVQNYDQQTNSTTTSERRVSVTQNIEITENNRTVRKNSLQEQNVKAITSTSNTATSDKKQKKKPKSSAPPPPADFFQNDTTSVASKRVPGGVEYTYSTQLDSGKTITTSKTVYEEEEVELTEEEIRQYKKTLKDAEKHKNVSTTKKLKSESGTKKIVPSENPGDVTTVETIKIEGGTEYHYTTVTSEGIVKKAVKTVYDPVPSQKSNPDDTDEEEIIEEYEEEIIEPGEKNVKTIETIKQLPSKFEEEVTITHERKEKKVKKSMVISQ